MKGLKRLAQTRGFDRRKPVVRVVQQMNLLSKLFAQPGKKLGREIQVVFGRPTVFRRSIFLGRLVIHVAASDAVGTLHPRDTGLSANGFVAELEILADSVDRGFDVRTAGVPVDQNSIPRSSPEQLVEGDVQLLGEDVPQCRINSTDRR